MFKIFRKNCCGLDVHKTWIYACVGMTDENGRTEYKQARFSSFSKGLCELAEWLAKYNCSDVCMESSGKYWIPVFNVLEKTCWVVLAHPKYTKPQKGAKFQTYLLFLLFPCFTHSKTEADQRQTEWLVHIGQQGSFSKPFPLLSMKYNNRRLQKAFPHCHLFQPSHYCRNNQSLN